MKVLTIPGKSPEDFEVHEDVFNGEIGITISYGALELKFETTSSVIALLDKLLAGLDAITEYKKLLFESSDF